MRQTHAAAFHAWALRNAAPIPSSDAIAALRRHPNFSHAIRSSAQSSVTLYRASRPLNALLSDRGRALFSHVALYLHFRGTEPGQPGLTVAAMNELCGRIGLCSHGRSEAMLVLMRASGLLSAAPSADRRKRVLAPTEKLYAMHHARWSSQFEAMSAILPQASDYAAALKDPAFMSAFMIALGARFLAGFRLLGNAPELAPFADRNAGFMILFSLALSAPAGEAFPPIRPVPLSINAMAARFSVSRKHVLTLLRDAEAQGLLLRGGALNDEVALLSRGREALEIMFATMFLYLAQCGDEAQSTRHTRAVEA